MFWCYMAKIVHKATRRIYQKQLPEAAHFNSPARDDAESSQNTDKVIIFQIVDD